MSEIRVRFAPSPTGYLHIGGARTALFNWLFAKSQGGKLILRIEDTDIERLKEDSVSQILTSLKWLGLSWDEGPEVGGDYGPYYQSERLDIYRKICQELVDSGKAYYCFCSAEDLEKQREKQRALKQPFHYARTCRDIPPEEAKKRVEAGEKYSVRIKLPASGPITVHDMIHGDVTFDFNQFDDFVIMKTNGIPTYNFAVVVDDHMMHITHVLRAEEHLSNTPKQIVLYEALGYEVPQFGHMPMILAPDRSKLSKRHGATSVEEFRDKGYVHQAIINYLTLLGWAPGNDQEIFTLEDTVKAFDFSKMSKKAAVYDVKKLTWLNGQYLSSLPLREIADASVPFFKKAGLIDDNYLPAHQEYFDHLVDVVRVRVKTLEEVADASAYFFKDVESYDEKGAAKFFKPEAAELLQKCYDALAALEVFDLKTTEDAYNKLAEDLGLSLGKVIHPTRLALTGRTFSPGMFDVMVLLGKEKTLARLQQAIAYIKKA
ncbi:glutamate--tRNA ligase [Acidaminococcus sp. NSJ-142]|jgi:glutamyl-tRNA synthetase|uniref:glutamate--tRNA ligase n=1 Tax=Acidaminococcus TaxID=904 RepID=UPI000CFA7DD1|nr:MULTISPECIES: glutamate--tRNA ligase [Acidaminococcus]MCD2434990.1 glutamate--tRNA ligase [Acidaminococcus hominis]MCH4096231.1 glutamate--tRNA ligase [Acidaminococcus provencensis]RHK01113.1 glutamate--tRNA ligase [Acidaminococcus sp. AM05-11]